jgi:hypothetical protein
MLALDDTVDASLPDLYATIVAQRWRLRHAIPEAIEARVDQEARRYRLTLVAGAVLAAGAFAARATLALPHWLTDSLLVIAVAAAILSGLALPLRSPFRRSFRDDFYADPAIRILFERAVLLDEQLQSVQRKLARNLEVADVELPSLKMPLSSSTKGAGDGVEEG